QDLKKAVAKFEEGNNTVNSLEKVMQQFLVDKPKRFLFRLGQKMIPKKDDEVALFFISNKIVHATEFAEGKVYLSDFTLEQLENEVLSSEIFFRINRKQIVNKEAIASLKPYKNQRLSLSLKIPSTQELIVSREKVNSFKAWFLD
ncbi:MAG: LytTR family DNA-binding domain-containing protein, partial [Bacteroidota bacterium]